MWCHWCVALQESPFNNIADEVKHHPLASYWKSLPWFDWAFSGNLARNDITFASDRYISNISAPVLILHAKVSLILSQNCLYRLKKWPTSYFAQDDATIPFDLGEKLYHAILDDRRQREDAKPVQFVAFSEELGWGLRRVKRLSIGRLSSIYIWKLCILNSFTGTGIWESPRMSNCRKPCNNSSRKLWRILRFTVTGKLQLQLELLSQTLNTVIF